MISGGDSEISLGLIRRNQVYEVEGGKVRIRDRYRVGSVVFEVTQRQEGKIEMED